MFGLDLKFDNLALVVMVLLFPLTQITEMLTSTGYSFLEKVLCNRSQRYRTRIQPRSRGHLRRPLGLWCCHRPSRESNPHSAHLPDQPPAFHRVRSALRLCHVVYHPSTAWSRWRRGFLPASFHGPNQHHLLIHDRRQQYPVFRSIQDLLQPKRLVRVNHLAVRFHGIFISGFSLALNYGSADMNWLGYFIPILTCPGIMPLILTLSWSGKTRPAAITSPLLGLVTGLTIWPGSTYSIHGTIGMKTTQEQAPCLYGVLARCFRRRCTCALFSSRFYKPYTFDWREFLRIELVGEKSSPQDTGTTTPTETEITTITATDTTKQPS